MSSKKVVRNNATAPVAAASVAAATPVAETQNTQPAAPKRQSKKNSTPAVEATATPASSPAASSPAPEAAAPVAAAPVAAAPAKGRGSRKAAAATTAPEASTTPASSPAARRGKKAQAAATPAASTEAAAPKAKRARKGTVTATVTAEATTEAAAEGEDDGRRSFKAKFENQELFDGRFIGTTPYQASSKALSIYYRNFKKANPNTAPPALVRFSICETTRGSNKAESSYIGSRRQLAEPVTYTITGKDGPRDIVKNFKNHLQRIKLGENGVEMVGGMPLSEYMAQNGGAAPVVATPAAPVVAATVSTAESKPKRQSKKAVAATA